MSKGDNTSSGGTYVLMAERKQKKITAMPLTSLGFPGDSDGKESAYRGHPGLIPGLGRSPGQGHSNPTPVFLPGEFHGQRSLAGYSPWGCKESDRTECLTLTPIFPITVFIPLLCSCVFNCISLMLSCMQHEGILLSMISQSIYCT